MPAQVSAEKRKLDESIFNYLKQNRHRAVALAEISGVFSLTPDQSSKSIDRIWIRHSEYIIRTGRGIYRYHEKMVPPADDSIQNIVKMLTDIKLDLIELKSFWK